MRWLTISRSTYFVTCRAKIVVESAINAHDTALDHSTFRRAHRLPFIFCRNIAYLFTALNELDGNQLLGHLVSAQLDKPKGPTVQVPDLQAVV
jgi:hypothetical protein